MSASAAAAALSPIQVKRERSIQLALWLDCTTIAFLLVTALISQSLTLAAEVIRGLPLWFLELFALLAMRKIHRGQLRELDFGAGKVEQMLALAIASGMILGALWILHGTVALIAGDRPIGTPEALALGAVSAAFNTYLNFIAWRRMAAATPKGSPAIMTAQFKARIVKLASSLVVTILLTISARFPDPLIVRVCDVTGALFVAVFILVIAGGMIRGGMPELLDKSVNETVQRGLNRALAHCYDDYDRLDRVRSRCSSGKVFVEVSLGFKPTLTVAEVDGRVATITQSIREEIAEADVSILVNSAATASPNAGSSA
jgi:divalent metal cation (Fe/Co/Zn/Cd) transporter